MGDGEKTGSDKPKRTRKAGNFRYQVMELSVGVPVWKDSEKSYKGPTEALAAGNIEAGKDSIIRSIRIASDEFIVDSVTTTVLKKRTK